MKGLNGIEKRDQKLFAWTEQSIIRIWSEYDFSIWHAQTFGTNLKSCFKRGILVDNVALALSRECVSVCNCASSNLTSAYFVLFRFWYNDFGFDKFQNLSIWCSKFVRVHISNNIYSTILNFLFRIKGCTICNFWIKGLRNLVGGCHTKAVLGSFCKRRMHYLQWNIFLADNMWVIGLYGKMRTGRQ